ncbi:MAG: rod shape-determining protein MreC [Proteobacteria bacterium]|nr:rod shape-determining protein MreC [Pseudomonadota bacterium]
MFNFLKRNRRLISAITVLLFFVFLISSQINQRKNENWFSAAVQSIAYPLQAASYYVKKAAIQSWNRYFWLVDIQQKNEQLELRIKELEAAKESSQEISMANIRLRKILEFQKRNTDIKVFSEVVGEIDRGVSQLLVINKGANHKIRRNFAVVSRERIIGKIQSVTSSQSVVQLITDPQSRVPVLLQRTRTKAILAGTYDGTLVIDQVIRTLDLKIGDKVVTSGLAGIYPKGFLVGEIDSIKKAKFGLFQSVTLVPSVDLNRIEDVAVILESLSNIQEPLFTDEKN